MVLLIKSTIYSILPFTSIPQLFIVVIIDDFIKLVVDKLLRLIAIWRWFRFGLFSWAIFEVVVRVENFIVIVFFVWVAILFAHFSITIRLKTGWYFFVLYSRAKKKIYNKKCIFKIWIYNIKIGKKVLVKCIESSGKFQKKF